MLLILRLQIDPLDTESSLTLSDLSPDDNGRMIICSAENMVGQTEASFQLNILCKAVHSSGVIDCTRSPTAASIFRNYISICRFVKFPRR